MRFIHVWAYSCANYLTVQLKENHEKRRVYYYGFQVFIGEVVKIALVLFISLLLGSLQPVAVILAVFAILRTAAGGYHMDTQGKCLAVSLALFLIPGIIVKYTHLYWSSEAIAVLGIATVLACVGALIKWIPADTPNRPITKAEEIKQFRIKSSAYMVFFIGMAFLLLFKGISMYSLALLFGVGIELFMVTPIAYRFLDWVSGKTAKRIK